jgi:hypothetical protein
MQKVEAADAAAAEGSHAPCGDSADGDGADEIAAIGLQAHAMDLGSG